MAEGDKERVKRTRVDKDEEFDFDAIDTMDSVRWERPPLPNIDPAKDSISKCISAKRMNEWREGTHALFVLVCSLPTVRF